MAIVARETKTGRRDRVVKNLGWLIKHGRDVDHFVFRYGTCEFGTPEPNKYDGRLEAIMRDGKTTYMTNFSDFRVMVRFLRRPMWYGLTLNITNYGSFGRSVTISKYGSMR